MKVSLTRQQTQTAAIADLTPTFALGVAACLGAGDITTETAASVEETTELLAALPNVLILDARMIRPDNDLVGLAAEHKIPVVLVVPTESASEVIPPVSDGVVGMWGRPGDPAELNKIVTAAIGGQSLVSGDLGGALLDRLSNAGDAALATVGRLTNREKEILDLMADGAGNRAIAESLFISENTVRNHVRNVLDKLQASTRTEAVVRALKTGLVRLK